MNIMNKPRYIKVDARNVILPNNIDTDFKYRHLKTLQDFLNYYNIPSEYSFIYLRIDGTYPFEHTAIDEYSGTEYSIYYIMEQDKKGLYGLSKSANPRCAYSFNTFYGMIHYDEVKLFTDCLKSVGIYDNYVTALCEFHEILKSLSRISLYC